MPKPIQKPGVKPEAQPAPQDDLKTLPMAEVEKKLESSPDGLTDAEAKKRLAQYGPNELVEKKTNLLLKFLSYFWGPIPWMIEIAVILSGVVNGGGCRTLAGPVVREAIPDRSLANTDSGVAKCDKP
jgi:magnesium-transporting ATPase (P-type)